MYFLSSDSSSKSGSALSLLLEGDDAVGSMDAWSLICITVFASPRMNEYFCVMIYRGGSCSRNWLKTASSAYELGQGHRARHMRIVGLFASKFDLIGSYRFRLNVLFQFMI